MRSHSVAEYQLILQMGRQVPERLSRPGLLSLGSVFGFTTGPIWTGISIVPHSATRIILYLFSLFSPIESKHLKARDHYL